MFLNTEIQAYSSVCFAIRSGFVLFLPTLLTLYRFLQFNILSLSTQFTTNTRQSRGFLSCGIPLCYRICGHLVRTYCHTCQDTCHLNLIPMIEWLLFSPPDSVIFRLYSFVTKVKSNLLTWIVLNALNRQFIIYLFFIHYHLLCPRREHFLFQ